MKVKLTLINKNYVSRTKLELGDSIILELANLNTSAGENAIAEAIKTQHGKTVSGGVGSSGDIWERSKA
jgi:hypothetical protein